MGNALPVERSAMIERAARVLREDRNNPEEFIDCMLQLIEEGRVVFIEPDLFNLSDVERERRATP